MKPIDALHVYNRDGQRSNIVISFISGYNLQEVGYSDGYAIHLVK